MPSDDRLDKRTDVQRNFREDERERITRSWRRQERSVSPRDSQEHCDRERRRERHER